MATAIQPRGLQKYADGGFISKLFGPKETVTEKYARQDAEFKAKHPERFQEPAPAATTPGIGGVKGLMNGSLTNAMQAREKAAGLKAGGMVKKCVTGGKISGPGGPTDDLVPIMASNGEFMIKASSAQVLGPKVLKALNAVGDGVKPKAPSGAIRKLAMGGEVKPMTWQEQTDLKNAQTGASSIFKDASQQQAAADVARMTAAPAAPTDTAIDQVAAPTMGDSWQQRTNALNAATSASSNSSTPNPFYSPIPQKSNPAMPQLAAGGMVRKMATGGPVEDERNKRIAKIPAGGNAPAPDGINTGNDLTRNVNNSLNALGGMGVVASVPLKAAQGATAAIGGMNRLNSAVPGATMLAGPVRQAADFVAGASGVAKVGGANLPTVINSAAPVAKTTNVALQEGAKANQMAAGVRSFGNASAGAGMLDGQQAPVAPPVAQLPTQPAAPSLNAPWYSPEYAKAANASDMNGLELERSRRANPSDANDPLKNLILNGTMGTPGAPSTPSVPGATPAKPAAVAQLPVQQPAAAPVNGRGQGYADPRQAAMGQNIAQLNDEFSNASIAQRNPGGAVRKVGNSYSGTNVSGDVSFQGADGNSLPGRPGGGFMVAQGMSPEAIKSALTNPDGSAWSAGDNAIMAANMRDGVDQYRGTSRDARNDPMNQPMTKDQRAARVRMAETASQDKRYADSNAIQREQLGMSRTEHVAKMAKEKQIADVQAEFMTAQGDPVKEAAAKRKMLALGLLKDGGDDFAYAPGGQVVVDGQLVTQPGVIFNKRTGQPVNGGQGTQAALPPGMTKQVGTANGKPVYEDANGKRFQ